MPFPCAELETRIAAAEDIVAFHRLEDAVVAGEYGGHTWRIWLLNRREVLAATVTAHVPLAECRSVLATPTPQATASAASPAALATPLPPCPTATPTPPPTATPTATATPRSTPTPQPRATATPTQRPIVTPLLSPDQRHYEYKAYMLEIINRERIKAGVPEVTLGVNVAAQLHAENALADCVSGHWGVDGLKPYMRYSLAGGYQYDAENGSGWDYCLGPSDGYRTLGSIESGIQEAMDGWMGSPGHRRNLLDPWHRNVNIGLAWDRFNFVAYQHFEGDYVRYDDLPQIRNGTLAFSGRTTNELRFSNKEELGLQLFYDPLPHTLTRGQVSRTYCYDSGVQIAAFRYPLTGSSYWTEDAYFRPYTPCPDPYEVSPDAPSARSVAEALRLHDEAKTALRPSFPLTIPWITASEWTASGAAFSVVADISDLLSEQGPGVYTILLWGLISGEDVPVSRYSIFHKVEPPDTYDPARWR